MSGDFRFAKIIDDRNRRWSAVQLAIFAVVKWIGRTSRHKKAPFPPTQAIYITNCIQFAAQLSNNSATEIRSR